MPRTTSQPVLVVQCPDCYALHQKDFWGSCEDSSNRYRSAEEYATRHPESVQLVEVLEFA
jgi:hypothetical protein